MHRGDAWGFNRRCEYDLAASAEGPRDAIAVISDSRYAIDWLADGFRTVVVQQHKPRKGGKLSPPGGETTYPRRWQFDSWRIYVRRRTGPQSAHG